MELKVTQCSVGRFNLCSNEENLSFYMEIYDDGEILELDGVRCRLYYSGDADEERDFEDAKENLDYVFKKCYEYASRVISSTDYMAEALAFRNGYIANFEAINQNHIEKETKRINDQIDRLRRELDGGISLADYTEELDEPIKEKAAQYQKWSYEYREELNSLKEDSEKYAEVKKKVDDYQEKADKLLTTLNSLV